MRIFTSKILLLTAFVYIIQSCKARSTAALRSDGAANSPTFADFWQKERSTRLECDPAKVVAALRLVRSSGEVPAIPVPRSEKQPVHRSSSALEPWLKDIFAKLSNVAFGRPDALPVIPCDDEQCLYLGGAMAMVDEPAIYVSTNGSASKQGAEKDPIWANKDAVTFIIAHEISHYLVERSFDLLGKNLTPCGQISLLRSVGSLPFNEQLVKGGLGHSEVDFFAYQLLKMAKIPYAGGLIVLKDQVVDPTKDYSSDLSAYIFIPEQIRANGYKYWMKLEAGKNP